MSGKNYGSSETPRTRSEELNTTEDAQVTNELTVIDVNEEEERLPQEPMKTLISGMFLLGGFTATTLSLAVTHDRVPTNTSSLPDIVLDSVTYQKYGLDVSEILLSSNLLLAVSVVLCQSYRMIILRRVWLVLGIIYYYRALTMFVTVLPKPDVRYQCRPPTEHVTGLIIIKRVLTIISGGGLSINGKHVYCGDYIFSGHTTTLVLSYLTVRQYCSIRALHTISLLLSLLGVIFLLLGRGHYTIDVVIAYYISTRLWWMYHLMAENRHLKNPAEQNYLQNEAWWVIARSSFHL